jgi:hypothetical protein
VTAIKQGGIDVVNRAVQALAMQKGIFVAPWAPPEGHRK